MIYKISPLLDDLRRNKVLGSCMDPFSFDLMWQGINALLLRFISTKCPLIEWVLIERTGKQYYKVKVLKSQFEYHYTKRAHFRNSRLTTEYIKNLIK